MCTLTDYDTSWASILAALNYILNLNRTLTLAVNTTDYFSWFFFFSFSIINLYYYIKNQLTWYVIAWSPICRPNRPTDQTTTKQTIVPPFAPPNISTWIEIKVLCDTFLARSVASFTPKHQSRSGYLFSVAIAHRAWCQATQGMFRDNRTTTLVRRSYLVCSTLNYIKKTHHHFYTWKRQDSGLTVNS